MSKINVFGQLFNITTDGVLAQIDQIKDVRTTGEFAGKFQSEINDAILEKLKSTGTDVSGKVDKVEGKSLVSDELITKLEGLSTQTVINSAIADAKKAGTDAAALANTAQSTIDNYKTSNDKALSDGLATKVDKVTGKSLVSDTEITKLAGLKSQTDMESLMDTKISSAIASVLKWQGVKDTLAEIQAVSNPTKGDVWHNNANGGEYVYNGTAWEELGSVIDLSSYATQAWVNQQGFLKEHQDLSSYATKTYVDDKEKALKTSINTNATNIDNINSYVAKDTYYNTKVYFGFNSNNEASLSDINSDTITKLGVHIVETVSTSDSYLYVGTNAEKFNWDVLVNGFPVEFTTISKGLYRTTDKFVGGVKVKISFIPTPNYNTFGA